MLVAAFSQFTKMGQRGWPVGGVVKLADGLGVRRTAHDFRIVTFPHGHDVHPLRSWKTLKQAQTILKDEDSFGGLMPYTMPTLYTEQTSKGTYSIEDHGAGYYAILFKTTRQKRPRIVGNGRSLERAKELIAVHRQHGTTRPDLQLDKPGIHRLTGLGRIDVTKHFRRERKVSPSSCAAGSFRAKKNKSGTLLTFCCPKGRWNKRTKRCRSAMKLQSIARPR